MYNYDFNCNIQQVKRLEFDVLCYGLFFADRIAIFKMHSNEILSCSGTRTSSTKAMKERANSILIAAALIIICKIIRYALTWKLCRLMEHLNSNLSLRNIARPFVTHLGNTLQLGAYLVVERDAHCMYLDCIDHPHPAYTSLQYIGKQAPLHAAGSGKVLRSACLG